MNKEIKKVNKKSDDIFKNELEKFKKIFPQFVTENTNKDGEIVEEINFDDLKVYLDKKQDINDEKERYNFTWSGKQEAFKTISKQTSGTLNPKKKDSVDWENTENVFIEGDNLEVLKLLQKKYRQKIKMIYIDPPYNTGKDFVYKDNFKDGVNEYYEKTGDKIDGIKMTTNPDSAGRYHSNWLSMMYPRLFLAKQLLKDDGVIFISIDDNEQHHLKMLMNEIFGEENFLGQIVRVSKTTSFRGDFIAPGKDYLFAYGKNIQETKRFKDVVDVSQYKKIEIDGDRKNEMYRDDIAFYLSTLETRPNQRYYIKCPDGSKVIPPGTTIPPQKPVSGDGVWRWNLDSFNLKKNFIVFKNTKNSPLFDENGKQAKWNIYTKSYLNDKLEKGNLPRDLWTQFLNRNGTSDLKKINMPFDFPKPVSLIKKIIEITQTKNDDIILDFFAGSATTGHAVMDLNKEDNEKEAGSGKRKFILVQLPETTDEKSEAFKAGYKNIAEISKDRLRKVIEKNDYKEGFKVFALEKTSYKIWKEYGEEDENLLREQMLSFTKSSVVENFEEEKLVYEILLKEGFSLNAKVEKEKDLWKIEDENKEDGEAIINKIFIDFSEKIDVKKVEELKLAKNDIFVCEDSALNDSQKMNFSRNFGLRVI